MLICVSDGCIFWLECLVNMRVGEEKIYLGVLLKVVFIVFVVGRRVIGVRISVFCGGEGRR